MRSFSRDLALAVVGIALFLSAAPACAQGIGSSYRYPTPALSPWFNLYTKQSGPVDNYNMYVRPGIQLQNTLQTQQFNLQRQATGAANLGQQVSQLEQDRLGVQPTGAQTGFMNYGRFFGLQNTTGQGGAGLGGTGRGAAIRGLPGNRGTWALPAANAHAGGGL